MSELAAAYTRIGSLTNEVAQSLESHQKALAMNERLYRDEPGNSKYCRQLSDSEGWVGNKLRQQGDLVGSIAHHRRQVAVAEELAKREPTQENRQILAEAYESLSPNLVHKGQLREAYEIQSRALALHQALAAEQPDLDLPKRNMALSTIMRRRFAELTWGSGSGRRPTTNRACAPRWLCWPRSQTTRCIAVTCGWRMSIWRWYSRRVNSMGRRWRRWTEGALFGRVVEG